MKRVFKINHAASKLTRYNQTEEITLTIDRPIVLFVLNDEESSLLETTLVFMQSFFYPSVVLF